VDTAKRRLELAMRKVVESTLVSADGVIGRPDTWTGELFGEEAVARALEQLRRTDAMVMGRGTYEVFSKLWGRPSGEYAAAIYNLKKYVFSSTLDRADWNNTEVVNGDVVATVAELKDQDGQDIVLYGHGGVGQALLEGGLLDELKLWVHPVIVGHGTLLFRPGEPTRLTLAGVDTTSTGVVVLTYHPNHT
jgi:dihydrofolate reductase